MTRTYPAVSFIAQHGRRLAIALGIVGAIATLAAWPLTGNAWTAGIGLPTAMLLWGVVRIASEVIEVVAETLLPR